MTSASRTTSWRDPFSAPTSRRRLARDVNQNLAWAYCRVSTMKDEQEMSMEEQTRWAREFAHERGLQLVIFEERASAKSIHGRKEFIRMMSELIALPKERRPALLLATSADRFARNMGDAILSERALRESGVSLYLRDCGGSLQTDTFAGQATLVAMSMGSQAENEARSNRAKASWERRRREGKPTSNKAPYGLQLRDERDEPVEGSCDWVRFVFESYASGVGMPTIARRLSGGAPPHRTLTYAADGKPVERVRYPVWEPNRVRKLLEQHRYRDVVVDAATFDRVQALLAKRPHVKQKRVFEYPLTGAIKCANCNRSFHGHATGANRKKRLANGQIAIYDHVKRVRYYQCNVCCYMINADLMEAWFRGDIRTLAADDALLTRWVSGEPVGPKVRTLRREIAALKRETDPELIAKSKTAAWALALAGAHAGADLDRQLAHIDRQVAEKGARLEQLARSLHADQKVKRDISQARELLGNFWALYEAAAYNQKRELVQNLVCSLGGATATKDGLSWARQR